MSLACFVVAYNSSHFEGMHACQVSTMSCIWWAWGECCCHVGSRFPAVIVSYCFVKDGWLHVACSLLYVICNYAIIYTSTNRDLNKAYVPAVMANDKQRGMRNLTEDGAILMLG